MRTLKYFIGTLLAAGLLAVAGCTGGENPNNGNGGPTDTTSPSVNVSPASSTVQPGGTVQVTANITDNDSNSVSVSWSASAGSISPSSDNGISLSGGSASSTATVDASGVSDGTTITVTADVTDSPGGNTGSGTATIDVQAQQQDTTSPSVTTSAASSSVSPGGTVDVTADVSDPDSNAVDLDWEISGPGSFQGSPDKTGVSLDSNGEASDTVTVNANSGASGTITVTANVTDVPGGNTGSDSANISVQSAAQAHEVPTDTFSVQVYEADGSTPVDATSASSSSSGYPTYDVQAGSCYFLVFTTGDFTGSGGSTGVIGQDGSVSSNSFPSGWDDSDGTLQHDTALSGNHAIANVNVAVGFPNNTIIPINQSGTASDDDTANAGLPDFALDTETQVTSETCTTRNKVQAGGATVTVGNPVYQSGSDDGLFDAVSGKEALGGTASPSANWLGIPPQTQTPANGGQFGVSSLVRAEVRDGSASNPWSVNPQNTTDLTSEFGGDAAWFQFNSTIQGPSRINEVVPGENWALLSIGVRIDSGASGTIPVRLLDYKYQGGSRSTALTVYQNLDGQSVVPKLQDITLNVQ